MAKDKPKLRRGQGKRKAPRTLGDFYTLPARQRESIVKTAHVLSAMRAEGVSLSKAAIDHGVSPTTVRRHAGSALRRAKSGKYKARADKLFRPLVLPKSEGLAEIATRDSRQATIAGTYLNAVQTFLQTGDDSELQHFHDQYIIDAEGNRVPLLTDLDELERLGAAGVLSFESLYARTG